MITLDYRQIVLPNPDPNPGNGTGDGQDYGDACSILVPAELAQPGLLRAMTSGGIELEEDSAPEWDPEVTYSANQRVYMPETHRVYESIKDGNTNKDPSQPFNQYNGSSQPTWWIDIGPTNRYAMFDGLVSTQTSAPSPLSITLTPGSFNGFALFGLDADSYSIEIRDMPGGSIYFAEIDEPLEGSMPADYYEYFFERFKPRRQFIRAGLDPYANAELTITFYKATGDVKVGMFAIGDLRPVGIPQRDASVEPQDFSYVKQDAFGNATVQKRANATGMSITTKMYKDDAGSVLDTVKEVLGVPVVVVGSQAEEFEWLTVFGLVSGRMSPAEFPYATLTLSVKGFI